MSVCPNCASEHIQRAEVAWGLGTKSNGQSVLATAIGPPERRGTAGATVAFVVAVLIAIVGALAGIGGDGSAAGMCCLLAFAIAAPAAIRMSGASDYNRNTLPGLQRKWLSLWLCLRCGHLFEVTRLDGAPIEDQPLPSALRPDPAPPSRQSAPHRP
jgi:hypothetical protein